MKAPQPQPSGPHIPVPLLLEMGEELGEGGLGSASVYNHVTAFQ